MTKAIITEELMDAIKGEVGNMNYVDCSILGLKPYISQKAMDILKQDALEYAEMIEWYLTKLTNFCTNEMIKITNYSSDEAYELAREEYKASNEELYTISGKNTGIIYTHVMANREIVSYLYDNKVFHLDGTEIY